MNPEIMRQLGFGKEMDLVNAGICPFCKCGINYAEFRTDLDLRENEISGLCQSCIDLTFSEPETEDDSYFDDDPYQYGIDWDNIDNIY